MKILTLILTLFVSSTLFGADKILHQQMTDIINGYNLQRQSLNPNRAVVYFSHRDLRDNIDYQEVLIDSNDISDGYFEITRPTTTRLGRVVPAALNNCQADVGTVTIQPTKLTVYVHKFPVIIFCQSTDGSYREAYHTIEKP
jgi:hypothetical protein